eukprot:1260718-Pleurochrysis_carterae.AAC.1
MRSAKTGVGALGAVGTSCHASDAHMRGYRAQELRYCSRLSASRKSTRDCSSADGDTAEASGGKG